MGGIGGAGVVKDNVLLIHAALDDLLRSSLEFGSDLMDNGDDERSNEREDEHGELLLQLFENLG